MAFTSHDETAITDAYDLCVEHIRRDYLDYFCDVAVEYYANIVNERREYLLDELIRQAKKYPHPSTVKVPIHTFETFVSFDKNYQTTLEDTLGSPGAYFKSPTRMNRANMHAIFRYSDFRRVFIKRIAPDTSRFFVTMSSEVAGSNPDLVTYKNTLWLNARVAGTIKEQY
jgi:hypothetical protein